MTFTRSIFAALALVVGSLPAPAQIVPPSLAGGVPDPSPQPGVLKLTLPDVIARALEHNLAIVNGRQGVEAARGTRLRDLAGVLPEVDASLSERRQKINLAAFGFEVPGQPPIVGPFNVFDARVSVSQAVLDLGAIARAQSGARNLDAAKHSLRDTRDRVVLASASLYLQALAARSRVDAAQAQLDTAEALARQAADLKASGVIAGIDVLRADVEADAQRQRLIIARNDAERQKLGVARAIGLHPGQQFELSGTMPFDAIEPLPLERAVEQAYQSREDLKSAESRQAAVEAEAREAHAARLPSVRMVADYGTIGQAASTALATFTIAGLVQVPVFDPGRQAGRIAEADAAVRRQRALIADLRASIAYDVRLALLDLTAAAERVKVAQRAADLAAQQLQQARDRFAAGVGDNVAIVQAQEAVATASDNLIASLYAHNLAKAALSRSLGNAEESAGRLFGFGR